MLTRRDQRRVKRRSLQNTSDNLLDTHRPGGPQEIDYHLAQHDREVYEALATLAGKLWRTAPEEYRRKLHQQIRPFNNVGVAGSPG